MSEEKKRLRIHAQIRPETEAKTEPTPQPIRWRSLPHPLQRSRPFPKEGEKLTFSDRMLRNSALACALLLAVLAMGNINQPWARSISQSVQQALTMRIDLDDSIGSLSFVRRIMPESALVFLNLSGESELKKPVNGELTHSFADAQPWLTFECPAGSEVYAPAAGVVTAVSELSDGLFGVLIDHGGGLESVCAYLSSAAVRPGDSLQRGQVIGTAENSIYFELREGEIAVDPTVRMGL